MTQGAKSADLSDLPVLVLALCLAQKLSAGTYRPESLERDLNADVHHWLDLVDAAADVAAARHARRPKK